MSYVRDPLGDKMKAMEKKTEVVLEPKVPVVIRLDGNSFSKFTKRHMEKPFDSRFEAAMDAAAISVLKYCAGAIQAYVQSDEITIMLRNDQKDQTEPFLANRVQKLTSILASTASVHFNQSLRESGMQVSPQVFDARAFTTAPDQDSVTEVFLWRQQDCYRNAISGMAYYALREQTGRKTAQKTLHGMNTSQKLQWLEDQGISIEHHHLYGRVIQMETFTLLKRELLSEETFKDLKAKGHIKSDDETVMRSEWRVLEHTPDYMSGKDKVRW